MNQLYHFDARIRSITERKSLFLDIAKKYGTPVYLYDKAEVQKNVRDFKNAFRAQGKDIQMYYAVKSNYYAGLLRTIVEEGEGLDVSSSRELKLALEAKAKRIIYTGPAKSAKDFALILEHHDKIKVNLESLRELRLLAKMAAEKKVVVQCGVRVYTQMQAGWTKFGIPLTALADFFHEAQKYQSINFCGIHFHVSWNHVPDKYIKTLNELAQFLQKNFTGPEREKFTYLDIGGGFYPQTFDGLYAWNPNQETARHAEGSYMNEIFEDKFECRFEPQISDPIEKFAEKICAALKNIILPLLPNITLCAEPGRFISHSSMHFLLTLMDMKSDRIGVTDGGNNIVGWEAYQFYYYAPIFNLHQFTTKREIPFITYGSLCTPDDIWGYYMYTADKPREGDILLMPFQGAYTYTLAQEFIHDIPPVIEI